MLHDPVADRLWHHLGDDFADHQLVFVGPDGEPVAGCNSAPLVWDGTDADLPAGWDDQFERSVRDLADDSVATALGALQIVVRPDRQGEGLSTVALAAMRAGARAHGLRWLIACVRPTAKAAYPLIAIDEYARWTREDGLPFDPWLRVHVRAGGRIVRGSPASMRIEGTVAEWRAWTGLPFPGPGRHLVNGVYLDPNVWVVHDLA